MPPSKYLGLGWAAWDETDVLLTSALDTLEALVCPCGCRQYKDQAWDESTEDWWDVHTVVCNAGAALAEWREGEGKNADEGTIPYLTFDAEGYAARTVR